MFLILEEYAPTLVPYSIDEGFLDFSSMDTAGKLEVQAKAAVTDGSLFFKP